MPTVNIAVVAQSCIVSLVYSIIHFAKKRRRKGRGGEPWRWRKSLPTLLVGAIVGVGFGMSGVTPSIEMVEAQLVAMGGTIALVDQMLKVVLAQAPTLEELHAEQQ